MTVRSLDRDRVLEALASLAGRIGASHREVSQVRLFGSLARDERNPYADADLLVVVDDSDLAPRDRPPRYKPVSAPVPLDLTVCTTVELEREVVAGNDFVLRVLAESRVLYERRAASPPT